MSDKLLFKCGEDWNENLLHKIWDEIEIIAKEELRIPYYKPQIEIVSAKQMIDAYTSVGMPIYYKHWSFGKELVQTEEAYQKGRMGLAYELVINSSPCIAYLMEENNALVQTLVMAHASVGHAAVFTNNYLFTDNTDATAIIDYLVFAKNYVKMCEEKYGPEEVEATLDACHALANYGVDKYRRPRKLSMKEEQERAQKRMAVKEQEYDDLWDRVGKKKVEVEKEEAALIEFQENILYFFEKKSPHLPAWKRELIRIVRKISQYFSPQRATKVLNEGYASFCHFYILNRMYDKGLLDGGTMIEAIALHGNVLYQRPYGDFNPYKLGFSIFMDIKRMCENPTDEDREYFPNLVGKDWVTEVNYAMKNFKDETFIQQYLSPKVARDLELFSINSESKQSTHYTVTDTCAPSSFRELRTKLANQYAIENIIPDIQIVSVDAKRTRKLSLKHFVKNGRPIDIENAKQVVLHASSLWEYAVALKTFEYDEEDGRIVDLMITAQGKYSGTGK